MAYFNPEVFSEPVKALISLGEKHAYDSKWRNYLEDGITPAYIPELLRILDNTETIWSADEVDEVEFFAPIHAWRALGQLQAEEAVPILMRLIVWNEEEDADWIMEEIPDVMGMIGQKCIPSLRDYLLDPGKLEWASITVANCLARIGQKHPEERDACVDVLRHALEQYAANSEGINGFMISNLLDLKAVEAAPLVERAYQANAVDLSVLGDFEDFQIELGLLKERLTPPPRFTWARDPQAEWEKEKKKQREEGHRQREQEKKEKKKQKQAKKARKHHKK